MKKHLLLIAIAILALATSCKKNNDTFPFRGQVVGYVNCTLASASISEMDFGYVVNLVQPDSIGNEYTSDSGVKYKNCVVVYRTRARYHDLDSISGTMYLDDSYSRAYCNYHFNLNLPEGVCYALD